MFTISETERTIKQERTVPVKSIPDEPADREKNNSYIKDMDFLPALIRAVSSMSFSAYKVFTANRIGTKGLWLAGTVKLHELIY